MRRSALAGLALIAGLAFTPSAARPGEAIKIGVQLPLSGERAAVGQIIKRSVEMAMQHVNDTGGIKGTPIAAVYADSQGSTEGAVAAARTLARDPGVIAIVGELLSPLALASREVVEEAHVPYLIGGTSPRTTERAGWVYRVAASDAVLAELLARYVVQDLQLSRIAVLSRRTGVHNARAELLVEVLKAGHGLAPVVRDTWSPEAPDFAAPLRKAKSARVDAIIALGETAEGAPFLAQVKALGIAARVIGHRDFGAPAVLAAAGAAAEDLLIVTEYMPPLMDSRRQAWARAYQQRHGEEPSIIAAQHYDAVLLVAEAIRRSAADRGRVKRALDELQGFSGVMADYTFDATHDGVHRFLVARISRGKPVLEAVLGK
jgi:branched-chain amino acid transport system substrate-binding protein